jgi:hypothetical protein
MAYFCIEEVSLFFLEQWLQSQFVKAKANEGVHSVLDHCIVLLT